MEPVGISSELCLCGHWREDHEPMCIVVEHDRDCSCKDFTPHEDDEWGYWFTDGEGRKMEDGD